MEWYHVWWPWLPSKRVARFVGDSWFSYGYYTHSFSFCQMTSTWCFFDTFRVISSKIQEIASAYHARETVDLLHRERRQILFHWICNLRTARTSASWLSYSCKGPRLSRSLRVIGTVTDRSATYDFHIVFSSNYSPISYRFRDGWRNLRKKISHPLYLWCTPLVNLLRLWA